VAGIIVAFKDSSDERWNDAAAVAFARDARLAVPLSQSRRMAVGAIAMRFTKKLDGVHLDLLMDQLRADPRVAWVEPDLQMYAMTVPQDPLFSSQWAIRWEAPGGINMPPVWDENVGNGMKIAVIDTGITTHPDLDANILPGYDFITDPNVARDGNGRDANPRDEGDWVGTAPSSWHGTGVAGIIAAIPSNGVGISGATFNAKIIPVRVLGAGGGAVSDISDAIVWASGGSVPGVPSNANPASILNLSLGGLSASCPMSMQNAISGAASRGALVVVAAGNFSADASGTSPANCANVLTVAATNKSRMKPAYSNFGATVDIAAPGGDFGAGQGVLLTTNIGQTVASTPGYKELVGTSMAAPHVAAVAAIIRSGWGPFSPAQTACILKKSALPLSSSECAGGCGAGFIQPFEATLSAWPVAPDLGSCAW
jgi:serine protease